MFAGMPEEFADEFCLAVEDGEVEGRLLLCVGFGEPESLSDEVKGDVGFALCARLVEKGVAEVVAGADVCSVGYEVLDERRLPHSQAMERGVLRLVERWLMFAPC